MFGCFLFSFCFQWHFSPISIPLYSLLEWKEIIYICLISSHLTKLPYSRIFELFCSVLLVKKVVFSFCYFTEFSVSLSKQQSVIVVRLQCEDLTWILTQMSNQKLRQSEIRVLIGYSKFVHFPYNICHFKKSLFLEIRDS